MLDFIYYFIIAIPLSNVIFSPFPYHLISQTPGIASTCAGSVKGVTYYQLYKCIPTADGGGEMWTTTLSNLGPLAKTEIFVDKYKLDPTCTVRSACPSCGSAPRQAQIDIGMLFQCQLGSTVWSIEMGPNLRGKDGVVEYKPFLMPSYSTHNMYATKTECQSYGVAPMVIQALPQRNVTTYMPNACSPSADSCGMIGRDVSIVQMASTLNPSTGISYNGLQLNPGLIYGGATCVSYDLNYLALLVLIVIPILIGTLVGIFVPVKPCPGCTGNDPAQRKNIPGWTDPRAKNTDVCLVDLRSTSTCATLSV